MPFFLSICISQFRVLSNLGNRKISAERGTAFGSHADKSNEKKK